MSKRTPILLALVLLVLFASETARASCGAGYEGKFPQGEIHIGTGDCDYEEIMIVVRRRAKNEPKAYPYRSECLDITEKNGKKSVFRVEKWPISASWYEISAAYIPKYEWRLRQAPTALLRMCSRLQFEYPQDLCRSHGRVRLMGIFASVHASHPVHTAMPNLSAHTYKQHKVAASRGVLPAGGLEC